MAIDINNYKVYVRDYGIEDTDLATILNDVIMEIAFKTRIFKTIIGFEIIDCVTVYDFGSIYKINMAEKKDLLSLDIIEPTLEDLLEAMNDGTGLEVKVNETLESSPENSQLIDVTDVVNENRESIFDLFDPVNDLIYEYKGTFKKELIKAYAIGSFIPDITLVGSNIEKVIKPALIAGVKYYLSSNYTNAQNLQPVVSDFQKWNNEINLLMSKYPYYNSKLHKRAWL